MLLFKKTSMTRIILVFVSKIIQCMRKYTCKFAILIIFVLHCIYSVHVRRQHNDQKSANNDLLNTTQKTKDQTTRTPQKPGVNPDIPEG